MTLPPFCCLLILSIATSSIAYADDKASAPIDMHSKPKNLKEELDRMMLPGDYYYQKPWTKKQREHLWRDAQNLSKAEILATRELIKSSECQYQNPHGKEAHPGRSRMVSPKCKGKKDQRVLVECEGTVKCNNEALAFWVYSLCFVHGEEPCPSARDCALKSDFGYKVKGLGLWNDADMVLNGWYPGVAYGQ